MTKRDTAIKEASDFAWIIRFSTIISFIVFLLTQAFTWISRISEEETIKSIREWYGWAVVIFAFISSYKLAHRWIKYDLKRGYFDRRCKVTDENPRTKIQKEGGEQKLTKGPRLSWNISNIVSSPRHPNKLLVKIMRPLSYNGPNPLPELQINGQKCGGQEERTQGGNSDVVPLVVNLEGVIMRNPRLLKFELSGENVNETPTTTLNPYFVKDRWLHQSEVRWQCEGHAKEKMILLKPDEGDEDPWKPELMTYMNFDFLVNGRVLGTFVGEWLEEQKFWYISIPTIKKHDCHQKTAVIRINHLQGLKLVLPAPVIMSRDHVRVN